MRAILGTMNMGQQVFKADAMAMMQVFKERGGKDLDTAYVYNEGACEELLGTCLREFPERTFTVATKVNPRITGKLDYDAVKSQCLESLRRLGVAHADVLYLHFPDANTPIEQPIKAAAELYDAGKIVELGVSNFPISLIEEMLPLCDELGCPRPTVFEGVYNALSRSAEVELFPALNRLGLRFHAYNPLAGGMLANKYQDIDKKPSEGRFALRAESYQGRYWKQSYFTGVNKIAHACDRQGIVVAQAALRWLMWHSCLADDRGDGIIIGASKMSQLIQNLDAFDMGPLSQPVIDAFDEAWAVTANDAPAYYRFYKG